MKNCDIEFSCSKYPESELDIPQLKAIITNSKLEEGSLFSSSYVTYTIFTKHLDATVVRRYSDFYWLHQIFTRDFLGVFVKLKLK